MRPVRAHRLRRRYGRAWAQRAPGYWVRPAPANSDQTNVYRGKKLVGTLMNKGNRWHWWLAYIPRGQHTHPSGDVLSWNTAYNEVCKADVGGPGR
jgi:hypothetical protein